MIFDRIDRIVMTLCGEYPNVVNIVKKYILKFSQEEQDMVMGGTAMKFYHLTIWFVCF